MTTQLERRRTRRGGRRLSNGRVLYWWGELVAIVAFYLVYSAIRNANGNHPDRALQHAKHIMSLEHYLGIFHEETLQRWALHFKPLIVTANYFYGSLHFVVTIFAGILLYRAYSDDYPRFRNTLGIATALALIGFSFFPLMPPRLLDNYGLHTGFVDTLAKYPTFWSFDSGTAAKISNQFAAMPSVHVAWATWCALALGPRARTRTMATLAVIYPVFTLVVIVITANHYILDAVGGLVILGLGWAIAGRFTRAGRGRDPGLGGDAA